MPARKNNPKKFGYQSSHANKKEQSRRVELIKYITQRERQHPGIFHHLPALFDEIADVLITEGFLRREPPGYGYLITHKFWMTYLSPARI